MVFMVEKFIDHARRLINEGMDNKTAIETAAAEKTRQWAINKGIWKQEEDPSTNEIDKKFKDAIYEVVVKEMEDVAKANRIIEGYNKIYEKKLKPFPGEVSCSVFIGLVGKMGDSTIMFSDNGCHGCGIRPLYFNLENPNLELYYNGETIVPLKKEEIRLPEKVIDNILKKN